MIMEALISKDANSLLQVLDTTEGGATVPFFGIYQALKMSAIRSEFQDGVYPSLPFSLLKCSSFQATDPRDHVFALHGITSASKEKEIVPNYRQATQSVYFEAATYAFRLKDPFCLFPLAGITAGPRMTGLPSWVPDFTNFRERHPLMSINNGEPGFRASNDTQHEIELRDCHVRIKGIFVDEIVKVAKTLPGITASKMRSPDLKLVPAMSDFYRILLSRIEEALALATEYCPNPYVYSKQPRSEAFWRTLIGDTSSTAHPAEPECGNDYRTWLKMLRLGKTITMEQVDPQILLEQAMSFCNISDEDRNQFRRQGVSTPFPEVASALMRFARGWNESYLASLSKRFGLLISQAIGSRQFAVTKKGYMALVPPGTDIGDAVCLFLAGPTPILLRRDGESTGRSDVECSWRGESPTYQLVGEAYVHGIMDGEGLRGDPVFKWFCLR